MLTTSQQYRLIIQLQEFTSEMKHFSRFDAKAYLSFLRVPETLGLSPSLDLLREVNYKQVLAIPYHNSTVQFMTPPLDISIEALQHRLVKERLGGNCYEISEFLYHALEFFGFETYRVPAWVNNGAPHDPSKPSAHNITIVRLNGDLYLLDSGFNYNSLRFPIKLGFDKTEQQTIFPGEEYQLECAEDHYQFNMKIKGNWLPFYRFDRQLNQNFPVTIDEQGTFANYNELHQHRSMIPIRDRFIKLGQVTPEGRIGFQYDFQTGSFTSVEFKQGIVTDGHQSYTYSTFFEEAQKRCNLVLQPTLWEQKYQHIISSAGGAKLLNNGNKELSQDAT